MALVVVLVALWLLKRAQIPQTIRECLWGHRYLAFWRRQLPAGRVSALLGYSIYVGLPVLLLALTQSVPWLVLQPIEWAVAIILLLASLHGREVETTLEAILEAWSRSDWQGAYRRGQHQFEYGRTQSAPILLTQTITQYWVQMNRHLFAPLFWFIFFNIAGLALFLLTRLLQRQDRSQQWLESPSWQKLGVEFLYVMEGVSARGVAVTIAALTLNVKVLAVAFRRFRTTERETEVILKQAVKMGLNFNDLAADEDERAVEGGRRLYACQSLRRNVLIFWLVALALLTVIS